PCSCPGLYIHWDVGPVSITYRFSLHDPTASTRAGYELRYCDMQRNAIYAGSFDCARVGFPNNGPCSHCSELVHKVQKVKEHASKPAEQIRHRHECCIKQLLETIEHYEKKIDGEHFKHLSTKRTLKRVSDRVSKYKEIISFAGKHQVPGVQRLLSTAVKNRWSKNKILKYCKLASKGKYHPKNYTQDDRDLAAYIYE
ncbi:hypothetical protein K435DRAFT_612167, partial [Dendrothele bispora CBS 962.96]